MNGASDAQVLELAFREDRILVTSNVDDFVKLVRAREIASTNKGSAWA